MRGWEKDRERESQVLPLFLRGGNKRVLRDESALSSLQKTVSSLEFPAQRTLLGEGSLNYSINKKLKK